MFPGSYFGNRYFAGRYWPKVGAVAEVIVTAIIDVTGRYASVIDATGRYASVIDVDGQY